MITKFQMGDRVTRVLGGKSYAGSVVGVHEDTVFVLWDNGTLAVLDELPGDPGPSSTAPVTMTVRELFDLFLVA